MKTIIIAVGIFAISTAVVARHVAPRYSPECNVTMPCDIAQSASRRSSAASKGLLHRFYEARQARLAPVGRVSGHRVVHTLSDERPGSGIVQAKSGATAHVASKATHAFQCVINGLEEAGYPIKFMGGFARGGHIRGSKHYAGLALDINQTDRNVTIPHMPSGEITIANSCGLISGAQWGDADSGHFQLGGWDGHGVAHHVKHHHRHSR